MTSPLLLQIAQRLAQLPSHIGWHTQAHHNHSLPYSIPILGNGSKGHADYSAFLVQLGEQVGPNGLGSSVEDEEPFVAVADLSDSAKHHVTSRRSTQ